MTEYAWPFDNSPSVAGSVVSESNWSKMASLWAASGVVKDYANELQCFGDSSGLQVKVKTGKAWLQGAYYESDAETTIAIVANASGQTRVDRVVVRVNWTTNTCVQTVIEGTPGAGAPAPTWTTTTWDLLLAQVTVVNGAALIAAGDVTDERGATSVYTAGGTVAAGYTEPHMPGIICLSTKRPTTYPVGGFIFEVDTAKVYTNVGTFAAPVWGHTGDTDSTTTSPHHTLGTGAAQAAAGNHTHTSNVLRDTGTVPLPPVASNAGVWWFFKAWGGSLTINGPANTMILPGATGTASTYTSPAGESTAWYCDGATWTCY
jgi:hypothetical protein